MTNTNRPTYSLTDVAFHYIADSVYDNLNDGDYALADLDADSIVRSYLPDLAEYLPLPPMSAADMASLTLRMSGFLAGLEYAEPHRLADQFNALIGRRDAMERGTSEHDQVERVIADTYRRLEDLVGADRAADLTAR